MRDPDKVRQLFDYCQILLATVSREGWKFLINTYGLSRVVTINRESGWFDEEDDQEAIKEIKAYCLIAGYDPVGDHFGDYDSETESFIPWAEGQ